MSVLNGFKTYHDLFGIRGVVAISSRRLFGFPTEIRAHPAGIRQPVNLRLRTSDPSVYKSVLLGGEYAIDLPAAPKIIVDAGANIGMASIYFTHKYPEAKIIAIEAEASNYLMLFKNVRPYPNILPVHAALWNADGEINIGAPTTANGAAGKWGFVAGSGGGDRVRAVTMRSLMSEMNIESIDLLKIDIEGAEKEVFQEHDWMEKVGCLVIELHERLKPGCIAAVAAATGAFTSSQRGELTIFQRLPR